MYNLKFIDFDQDINHCAIIDNKLSKTLFLCPNHASLKELQFIYQQHDSFNGSEFLTMDNFKLKCLNISSPLLKEEKRTLAFYAALKPQYREKFHINNYFQAVKFAYDFLFFFDELAEEMIDTPAIYEAIGKSQSAENWQIEHFRLLLEIKKDYLEYISARGFTDLIFNKNIESFNTDWLSRFQNIVVINQFYFTALEKRLLNKHDTHIYLQIPPEIYDKEELCCLPEFNAAHLNHINTKSIHNHVFSDVFSLKQSLFDQIDSLAPNLIIDFGMLQQHLESYNCRHLLAGSKKCHFFSSSLFQFYEQLHSILSSIIRQQNKFLIPINTLISTFNNKFFTQPFLRHCFPQHDTSQLERILETLLSFIYTLTDRDFKYIDMINIVPGYKLDPELLEIFQKLHKLLDNYSDINTIADLITALISSQCILPEQIINDSENQLTDLAETYYDLVEDFSSLDKINLFPDWNSIFPGNNGNKYFYSSQFLRLFLEFAKSKSYSYQKTDNSGKTWQISTLHNTRNLHFKNIIIADTIEGVIPPNRQTPFLLSEFQRKSLKLITYDDIVLREKYYFFRLIATSEYVHCFSRTSPADRTEISSFIEELHLTFPDIYQQNDLPHTTLFSELCQNLLTPESPDLSLPLLPDNFFTLPYQPEHDLKEGNFYVSPSNITRLIDNPFSYYLENLLYIKERKLEIEMDYTPLQIGNLVHNVFNNVWERILELKAAYKGQQPFCYNQQNYAERALQNLLQNNLTILLQKPYNYSDRYFNRVICPMITEAIIEFLKICDQKYTGIPINILPEKGNRNLKRKLFDLEKIPVFLKGRADLRIEIPSSSEKHIYDYKSGKYSKSSENAYNTQLLMYKYLYYPQNDLTDSWLFFVTGQELKNNSIKSGSSTEFLKNIIDNLKKSMQIIIDAGFQIGDKKDRYENESLTRRELAKQKGSKS
ncbi:MAG: PD-(D/E)XK nuclease family protein [Candidatus Cloacimonetes bacterium]|nr:PD-(D/E)XK nuclease family protein [Candidatus Cloacimonadota bacterium]